MEAQATPATLTPDEQFQADRLTGIGGSDAPVILGLSSYKTPLQLWAEKTRRLDPMADSPMLRRGRKLEVVTRSEYAEETGYRVIALDREKGEDFFRHPKLPWMIVHLDGKIDAGSDRDGIGAFEGKAANIFKRYEWEDEAPLPAQVQLQHGMEVCGLQWGAVAGLLGGLEFKYQEVARNFEFIASLMEAEAAFWKHVESDTPPDPVADDVKLIGRVFQAIEGTAVDLEADAIQWDLDRLQASEELKRWQELKDEAESKLKFAIGQAERGKLPNGVSYSFKETFRKAYTVEATSFRTLRRSAAK